MTSAFITAMIGPPEIIIIAIIVLLLFGGRKIPELMKGLGKGMREFKDAQKEEKKNVSVEGSSVEGSKED
ncbi:MAG: twin-arginine translocase TatA/TatE family subunit [Bacteroidota bacterium]